VTRSPARRLRVAVVGALVLLMHVWLAGALDRASRPDGRGRSDAAPAPLQVRFVAVLRPRAPEPPPWPTPLTTPPAGPAPVAWPAITIQEPQPAASAARPTPEPAVLAQTEPAPQPGTPADRADAEADVDNAHDADGLPSHAASAAGPSTDSASADTGRFDWPPSTRLRYALTGYYRGPVEGVAEVEWLREGGRYQIHLDLRVGPPFAPLITRRLRSDGRLTPQGLDPQRYEETTQWLFGSPRRLVVTFEPDAVRLANGRRAARLPALQDAVSQFVQLAWRFTVNPGLLQPGQVITVPLALPWRVERWVYDVQPPETLPTQAGPLQALRLKPRRTPRPGGDLVPEAWYAPALMNLPVRMHIRQGTDTWVDLVMDRWPEQAALPAPVPQAAPTPPSQPDPYRDPGSIGGN